MPRAWPSVSARRDMTGLRRRRFGQHVVRSCRKTVATMLSAAATTHMASKPAPVRPGADRRASEEVDTKGKQNHNSVRAGLGWATAIFWSIRVLMAPAAFDASLASI